MGSHTKTSGHRLKHRVGRQLVVEPPSSGGAVRQETHPPFGAILHHPLGQCLPKKRVQPVLHAGDRSNRLGLPDLGHRHVGQADPTDLALTLKPGQRAHTLRQRHFGIRRMQLVQIDAIGLQTTK